MKHITSMNADIRKKILDFLYQHEQYQAILIELLEKNVRLGELYVNECEEKITEILHMKHDGNSEFTSFGFSTSQGLHDVARTIRNCNHKQILLAGKRAEVDLLLQLLGCAKTAAPNYFYQLNLAAYKNIVTNLKSQIRPATLAEEDVDTIKDFTAQFFGAETEEEIAAVTNQEIMLEKIKAGIYLLEYENRVIGMARFIGETKQYAEITSVYVDKAYRNKGFGKELIAHMIEVALKKQKLPILVTSATNTSAIKTYESLGFEIQEEYAYEFLD